MALTTRLSIRQTQAPVMTPQLQQAIKLLQLSNLELAQVVEQELEENPLLEREDSPTADDAQYADDGDGDHDATEAPDPPDLSDLAARESMSEPDAEADADYSNVWADDAVAGAPEGMNTGDDGAFQNWGPGGGDPEGFAGRDFDSGEAVSLRDHLGEQLHLDMADPAERLIGHALIEALDDAGYLTTPAAEIATQLGCTPAQLEAVLARMQRFDPSGIFARNLAECFALQLAERNRLDPAMQAFLDNLELLGRHDFAALSRICGVDNEDLADMAAELKTLDPRPAARFAPDVTQWITPDVLMRAKPGGGWIIELNNDTLPRVLVNRSYYAEVSGRVKGKDDKAYLHERLQTARWLVKALDQRATTILRVSTEIVRHQDAFFRKGIAYLKPLILNDIAQEVDMHESTVSRVTANKYIATPRGLFELKYFFTTAVSATAGGEMHSAESVRHRIKLLIDAEAPGKVLSDDSIVDILRTDGVDIARRTVAKYRDSLHIPSSVQRRRMKSVQLPVS